jgi:hypothetical protein
MGERGAGRAVSSALTGEVIAVIDAEQTAIAAINIVFFLEN